MQLWIILPAYNEGKRIYATLEDYSKASWPSGISSRIVVVSDSTDETNSIVTKFAKRAGNITLIKNKVRKGKGYAILKGFRYAIKNADHRSLIGFVDADDAVPSKEYSRMIKIMINKNADGIVASRYARDSVNVVKLKTQRVLASRCYNLLVRVIFGINLSDTQCGAKIFRYDALRKVIGRIVLLDVSFDLNILYEMKRAGFNIIEAGIVYLDKKGSSMNIKLPLRSAQMFIVAIGFRIYHSRFNFILGSSVASFIHSHIKDW